MTPVEAELQRARELLIDLTPKNRFLNYRPTKRRTVELVLTEVEQIYKELVLAKKSARLVSRDQLSSEDSTATQHDTTLTLETDLPQDLLELRLPHLYRQANSVMDEQGYNALHLALPFIAWTESPVSNQLYYAPLLLIPVMLKRKASSLLCVGKRDLMNSTQDVLWLHPRMGDVTEITKQ
ncbi:MAG: DUF4011 domain-containing protein, partial [Deltaproteobacteria bacterium]|nr:DUF4011 domain-containing protein [Deltaproteobacteria bacterium]